jgi:hypothetical protein
LASGYWGYNAALAFALIGISLGLVLSFVTRQGRREESPSPRSRAVTPIGSKYVDGHQAKPD